MDYRVKRKHILVDLPNPFVEEKRGGCKPCNTCNQLVLANVSSTKTHENDKKGVFLKKGSNSDAVAFTIEKNGVVLSNLGEVGLFPNDSLTVGFIYDWKQYLSTYGQGCYIIKCTFNIAGVAGGYPIGIYTLKNYSVDNAKGTTRLWSKFNSLSLSNNVDFTGSNFEDMIRFNGYFGDRKTNTETTNLINKGRISDKVTRENLNSYELRTDPLNECRTTQILDFHLLHEDELFISDYNRTNHSYKYLDKAVAFLEVNDVNYLAGDRGASIVATFGDKILNQKSMYNNQ